MPEPGADVTEGVPVTIDGVAVEAREGELLIDAAERTGTYIPRFCYHERMRPVGMCRMCLVEVDTGRGPTLQPSCMVECTPDMDVVTDSPVVKKAQDGVLEFLLINHPLDCPVCDKGGECPLQDQTMAYGPGESRYVEEKRHLEKPIPVSDLVLLDRERCILCDRCTRFAKEVAGDPLISFIHRGNQTEVNTFPDEPFSSYFSGNTVQICPVGALTATAYRFKARPWDLQQSESTCQTCSVGCRVAVQSSRNEVLRYQGVDIDPVNWGWLCDKGRYAFESVNSDERLGEPLVRDGGDQLRPARWSEALGAAADALRAALDEGPGSIAVLGGARLTNEDAYAWAKLAKGVLGTDNVDAQLADGLPADLVAGLPRATIDDACRPGGTVVLVGPDPKEELPVLYLRLRHAAVEDGVKVIEVVPRAGGLSPYAAATLTYRPGEVGDVVRALVGEPIQGKDAGGVAPDVLRSARSLLADADGPVTVLVGRGSVAEAAEFTVDAAGTLLRALPGARFLPLLRRATSTGPSTWAWPPGCCRAGSPWPTAPSTWPPPGARCRPSAASMPPGSSRPPPTVGSGRWSCSAPTRWPTCPTATWPSGPLAGAGTVIATDCFLNESSSRPTWCCPPPASPRWTAPPPTSRAGCRCCTSRSPRRARPAPTGWWPPTWPPGWAPTSGSRRPPSCGPRSRRCPRPTPGARSTCCGRRPAPTASSSPCRRRPPSRRAPSPRTRTRPARAARTPPARPRRPTPPWPPRRRPRPTRRWPPRPRPTPRRPPMPRRPPRGRAPPPRPAPAVPAGPPMVRAEPGAPAPLPPKDAYGLRLVATRRLYDRGVAVQRSDHLAGLAAGTQLHLNPYDFDRLGVAPGDEVRVKVLEGDGAERRRTTVPARPDDGVPRGAASLVVNQPGVDVHALLSLGEAVVNVRVDSGDGA